MKENINLTSSDQNVKTPIVFGTVTHGWERKLRMMHPPLYSLLSVADNPVVI